MTFIWNDYTWKFIDKADSYDEKNFVIVRKLFVTPVPSRFHDDENPAVCRMLIRKKINFVIEKFHFIVCPFR